MGISSRLKQELKRKGWSIREFQRQVAAAADEDTKGVSYPSVYQYVDGRVADPPLSFLEVAAETLGVRTAWLAFGDGARTAWWEGLGPAAREELVRRATRDAGYSESDPVNDELRRALVEFSKDLESQSPLDSPWGDLEMLQEAIRFTAAFVREVEVIRRRLVEEEGAWIDRVFEERPVVLQAGWDSPSGARAWYESLIQVFAACLVGAGSDSNSENVHGGPDPAEGQE